MDRRFASERYTTRLVKDRSAGYEGYELVVEASGVQKAVARIVYWDAAPGFFVEMLAPDVSVPLDFFEMFIAETLAHMKAG